MEEEEDEDIGEDFDDYEEHVERLDSDEEREREAELERDREYVQQTSVATHRYGNFGFGF